MNGRLGSRPLVNCADRARRRQCSQRHQARRAPIGCKRSTRDKACDFKGKPRVGSIIDQCSRPLVVALSLLGMAVLVGCPQKEAPPPSEKTQGPVVEPNDPAVVDIPFDKAAPDDPARLPKPPQQRPLEVAVRYILVSHVGVKNGVNEREKSAAEKRAWRLAQAARKQGADFGALARRFSDAPAASRGALEVFREGDADPAFLDAAMGIGVGQVADPVHTEFGYYVILREELEEYSTAHILVIYKGAKLAPPAMKRTKEEAHKRALMLLAKARKKGANFALLAGRYSDSPSKVAAG